MVAATHELRSAIQETPPSRRAIRQVTAEIRRGWSDEERLRRQLLALACQRYLFQLRSPTARFVSV